MDSLQKFKTSKFEGENYLAVDLVLDGGALGDLHVDAHLLVHCPAGGLRDRPGYRPARDRKVSDNMLKNRSLSR